MSCLVSFTTMICAELSLNWTRSLVASGSMWQKFLLYWEILSGAISLETTTTALIECKQIAYLIFRKVEVGAFPERRVWCAIPASTQRRKRMAYFYNVSSKLPDHRSCSQGVTCKVAELWSCHSKLNEIAHIAHGVSYLPSNSYKLTFPRSHSSCSHQRNS